MNLQLVIPSGMWGIRLIFLIEPYGRTKEISFVVNAYSNPEGYSQEFKEIYQKKLDIGDVIIINTNKSNQIFSFNRKRLIEDLIPLLDESLNPDQKLEKISKNLKFIDTGSEPKETRITGNIIEKSPY